MNGSVLRRQPLVVMVLVQLFGIPLWISVNGVGLSPQQALGWTPVEIGWRTGSLWADGGVWVPWLLLPGPLLGSWALSRLSAPRARF